MIFGRTATVKVYSFTAKLLSGDKLAIYEDAKGKIAVEVQVPSSRNNFKTLWVEAYETYALAWLRAAALIQFTSGHQVGADSLLTQEAFEEEAEIFFHKVIGNKPAPTTVS